MYKYRIFLLLVSAIGALGSCYYDNEEDLYQNITQQECSILEARYAMDIVPILETHCIRCHRDGREDGNVNLQGYNKVKNYADNGSLYGSTNHDPAYAPMPTSAVKIPVCEIELIRMWVDNGALNN